MQSKSLEEKLSAYFCGIRADRENSEVVFVLPKAIRRYQNVPNHPRILVLEIRIREADINTLFAFAIAENEFVLDKDSIAVAKDENNKVLWHGYGQPLCLLHREREEDSIYGQRAICISSVSCRITPGTKFIRPRWKWLAKAAGFSGRKFAKVNVFARTGQ